MNQPRLVASLVSPEDGEQTVRTISDDEQPGNDIQATAIVLARLLHASLSFRAWIPKAIAYMIVELGELDGPDLPDELTEAANQVLSIPEQCKQPA